MGIILYKLIKYLFVFYVNIIIIILCIMLFVDFNK